MKHDRTNIKSTDASPDRFDRVIEALLISLLVFMPLAFGAVEAWSEEIVIALAAAISVCFLLKLVRHTSGGLARPQADAGLVRAWAYILVAVFILIAIFQIIPLPASVVELISPDTAAAKKELLADLPNANELLSSMTLSFYPHATRHDLRLLLAVAAVFMVVVNSYRRSEQIKRLLAAIAIIGGAVAVLALAQDLFGNGKIYWFVPTGSGQAYSGPFINHSHFGQFMNLSLGAALGLIMVRLHEAFTGKKVTPPLVAEYLSSPQAKWLWTLIFLIILGVSALFVSLTRGGMISTLIAAAFTTLAISSRRSLRGRSWIMALMALGAFICVLYIGFDAVYDRLATIRELHEYHGRWQIVKDIAVAWTKFPLLGTGLGTHEVVYPMFDRSMTPALASHAENEYAQAAEETGLIGLLTLIAFGIIVWRAYVRNVTTGSVPIRSAAYGLGFGLMAILVHSLSDFGQHLPANAMLSAVSCALLLSIARIGRKDNPTVNASQLYRLPRVLSIAVLVCACGIWAWAIFGADKARAAEAHWKMALAAEQSLSDKNWQGTDEEYITLIQHAAAAADYQPQDVKYRHWLNVYRWHSLSRVTDPNTGAIIIPEQALSLVQRIVSDLNAACLLCPTYGASYCVAGQLKKFVLDDPNGAADIQTGYCLAPCDPTACFVAGQLDATEGRIDDSYQKLQRAIQLDGALFKEVADLYVNHLNRPELAVKLAGDDGGWLSHVANILADTQEHKDTAQNIRARVIDLLKAQCQRPDAPASAFASLANIYRSQNEMDAAIEYYRRALALDYGQVNWRFTLAGLLAQKDQIQEAIHEARICLRLRPQFKAAEKLIADLSVRPVAENRAAQNP